MAVPRSSQFLDPSSAALNTATNTQKLSNIQIAKEHSTALQERADRLGQDVPKFTFIELIGKGGYGRVYKCRDDGNNRFVAVKVLELDSLDYVAHLDNQDNEENLRQILQEIEILKQLRDVKARNINLYLDAFSVLGQFWIVNDYCPGGSAKTLARATRGKLDEKYIIPLARELALGLQSIHDAGIIHRDVKPGNVMIHENGSIQIIDFGVSAVLQSKVDKRRTVIGTGHFMAPEMLKAMWSQKSAETIKYGTEVDVWAFGCTLIEFATGLPPNSNIDPRSRMLSVTVGRNAPALIGEQYSEKLRSLVSFVVASKPGDRPTVAEILQHPYLHETETTHPTKSLAELVKNYYLWEYSGGQRQSLLFAGGAAASEYSHSLQDLDEWNFSTTVGFEQQVAQEDQSDYTTPTEAEYSVATPTALYQTGVSEDTATALNRVEYFQGGSTHSSYSTFTAQDLTLSGASTPRYPTTSAAESPTSQLDNYQFSSSSNTPLFAFSTENEMSDNISLRDQSRELASAMLAQNVREEGDFNDVFARQKLRHEEQIRKETRVKRGKKALEGLFDEEKDQYKFEAKRDFDREVARELARLEEQEHKPRSDSEHPSYFGSNESISHNEFQYSLEDFDPDPHDDMGDQIASEASYERTQELTDRIGNDLPLRSAISEPNVHHQFNYSLDDFQIDPPGDDENDLSQELVRATQQSRIPEYESDLPLHSTTNESTLRQQFEYSLDDFQIDPQDDEKDSHEPPPKVQRGGIPRAGSDLPLRATSNESAVHHELEYSLANRSDSQDAPSIDLANVNTIKATKKQSRRLAKDDNIYKSATSELQVSGFDDFFTDNTAESSKRAIPSSDDAAGQAAQFSKRETMEWSFSTAMGESCDSAATLPRLPMAAESIAPVENPSRPQLKHSTTAPVGRMFASSGVLDLDAMLAGHPSNSYATVARPTFDDEQTKFPEVGAPLEATSAMGKAIDQPAEPQAQANPSGTSISSEDDHLDADDEGVYDPFQLVSNDEDKVKEEIEEYLATIGEVDPVRMADLRQHMLETRMAAKADGDRALMEAGYVASMGHLPTPWTISALPEHPIGQWFDTPTGPPARHPAREEIAESDNGGNRSGGSSLGDDRSQIPAGFDADVAPWRRPEARAERRERLAGPSVFAEIVPPSAESLMQDAAPAVVEGELQRLLTQFNFGLAETLDRFDEAYDGVLEEMERRG